MYIQELIGLLRETLEVTWEKAQLIEEIVAVSSLLPSIPGFLQGFDNETLRIIRDTLWERKMTREVA